jgi:hypothetical protein
MKINPFYSFVILLLTAIIAYSTSVYCQNNFLLLYTIVGSSVIMVNLLFLFAISFNNIRTSINIKTLSSLFLIINLALLFYFSSENKTKSSFIIVFALMFLIHISIVFSISKVKA